MDVELELLIEKFRNVCASKEAIMDKRSSLHTSLSIAQIRVEQGAGKKDFRKRLVIYLAARKAYEEHRPKVDMMLAEYRMLEMALLSAGPIHS